MAVAWCINAYDCNGCLIQTLQNLDSACIGVGVQYTAPNPLDDKRIDYIKYTDKCGCTCCLSAENEILIYATNGVIKNLTLTNDDVNEAIKIKWNDIFWSNRAKTIVRYKTGSAPVSITDGTLAVEETTKNQYSSTPFSLTGVLDETTYYISAFAVDWDGTIINVQSSSVTTDFLKPIDLLSNIVAYYSMQWNLNDESWHWYNLSTLTWSYTWWTNYNTVSNWVWSNTSITYQSTASITLSSRINLTTTSGAVICLWDNAIQPQWWMQLRSDWDTYVVVWWNAYNTTPVSIPSWFHMISAVFNYSAHTLKFYLDWVLKQTVSIPSWWIRSSSRILIWSNSSTNLRKITWKLWITFMTQNAMSDAQVLAFYNKSKKIYWIS